MKHPFDLHPRPQGRARHHMASRPTVFRPRRSRIGPQPLVTMILVGIFAGLVWAKLPDATLDLAAPTDPATVSQAAAIQADFSICHTGGGTNCVVDGDTFWIAGEKIRIADIDTPETHPPRCPREAGLGQAATRRLQTLLNSGAVSLESIDRDTDRYGRKLRIVSVNGQGVGATLIAEGLARAYAGGRRAGWCD